MHINYDTGAVLYVICLKPMRLQHQGISLLTCVCHNHFGQSSLVMCTYRERSMLIYYAFSPCLIEAYNPVHKC
jgi:hypothetical protein